MLSTDQMSLNYRAFPERLQQMFENRLKEEKELDHWRYDMMGQTMLIRNSEGDYSPAHRSLLEFFVAYKIVASLGAMAADFTTVARDQSYLADSLPSQDYTWDSYFERKCDSSGQPEIITPLRQFESTKIDELLPVLSRSKLAKAVLDLAHLMLDDVAIQYKLLSFLQTTVARTPPEVGFLCGNIVQLMLEKTPYALTDSDLSGVALKGVDFTGSFLRRTNMQEVHFLETTCSKVLGGVASIAYHPEGTHLAVGDHRGALQVWEIATGQVI